MVRLACVKCGSVDYPQPIKRRNRNGKWTYVRRRTCVMCLRDESRAQYEKTKADPVKWANYVKLCLKSQRKNASKKRAYQKKYDAKNAELISQKRKLKREQENMYLQERV